MNAIGEQVPPKLEPAIFIHSCCSSGMRFFKEWNQVNNNPPKYKFSAVTTLIARDKEYDKKYGFALSDLHKHAYIVVNEQVIIGDA